MAVEHRRGCGYRKVGGLYLVGGGIGRPCDRLPFELKPCEHCERLGIECSINQSRGWTWINPAKFFGGEHRINPTLTLLPEGVVELTAPCSCQQGKCQLCKFPELMTRAGLLWIGEKFYKSPEEFLREGHQLGFSRRISAIPRDFKIGETWVFLAHPNTVPHTEVGSLEVKYTPGIFYVWMPQRIEKILPKSEAQNFEEIQALEKRGITPVFVPDNDPDHRGNVHDDHQKGEE